MMGTRIGLDFAPWSAGWTAAPPKVVLFSLSGLAMYPNRTEPRTCVLCHVTQCDIMSCPVQSCHIMYSIYVDIHRCALTFGICADLRASCGGGGQLERGHQCSPTLYLHVVGGTEYPVHNGFMPQMEPGILASSIRYLAYSMHYYVHHIM